MFMETNFQLIRRVHLNKKKATLPVWMIVSFQASQTQEKRETRGQCFLLTTDCAVSEPATSNEVDHEGGVTEIASEA
jgi:hypothetical protein